MDILKDKKIRISIGENFSCFKPYTINFLDLPKLLCAPGVMYSPCQFKDNIRRSSNFLGFADCLIFDFDEGWSPQLEALFNQWICYKVPTKSHMKEKNGVICERYRIVLLLNTTINLDYTSYKRLYKHIIKDLQLPADTSCVDATRFYYSAYQPISNVVKLNGTQYFPWERFNYRDFSYAPLSFSQNDIDISAYAGLDVSYFDNLQHSKRYPCPLCRAEGLDQKGHHLGFNTETHCVSCFYDEEHSKILRKLYRMQKQFTMMSDIEKIANLVESAERKKVLADAAKASREKLEKEKTEAAKMIENPETFIQIGKIDNVFNTNIL